MINLKKISVFLFLFLLGIGFTSSVYATPKHNKFKHVKNVKAKRLKAIAAPLDGGVLALLGAAGVGYYLIRKKKMSE